MAAKVRIFLKFCSVAATLAVTLAGSGGCGAPQSKQDRERSGTRLELAKGLLRKGQLVDAEAEAQKALALDADNEQVHYMLGLIDLVHAHAAHRMIEIESCLTGIDAEVQLAEEQARLRAAEAHLARATELAPDFGEAWVNRGIAATLLDGHGTAIAHLERALEHPDKLENVAFARAALGWAHFLREDMVAATRALLEALRLQPRMCVATYRLGRVYFARKEWEKALEKFQDVVDQPRCPIQDAHLYLMKSHVELGSVEALPELGRVCAALAPESCIAAQCLDLAGAAGSQAPVSTTTTNTNQVP